jgi:hypothetical protein
MQPIVKLLLWVLSGLVLGAVIYYIALAPAAPPASPQNVAGTGNGTLGTGNGTPAANATGQQKIPIAFTLIRAPGCSECVQGDDLLNRSLLIFNQTGNFSLSEPLFPAASSDDGKSLIAKYNITRLPALIITGNMSSVPDTVSLWHETVGSVEPDGALVSRNTSAPYYDVSLGTVSGLVQGIGIAPLNCTECFNASLYFESLSGSYVGMVFKDIAILDENDSQAREFIDAYNITRLPTIILDAEARFYPVFSQSVMPAGAVKADGWFVLNDVVPPYVDLAANHTIRGRVASVYLVNESCGDCFDVDSLSKYIEDSAGLYVNDTKSYDVNSTEGQALLKKYNITMIPGLLYSPEASVYPMFEKAWVEQNNTVESDGWFVFRMQDVLGQPYQNVSAG